MSFRSACDPHAYGARGWTSAPDVSIQVFQEPAVGSTGLTPVQIHGPVGIGPVKTASDPSFWPWTTTMRPTMWPKFRPLTTTPGFLAWTEAARAVSPSAIAGAFRPVRAFYFGDLHGPLGPRPRAASPDDTRAASGRNLPIHLLAPLAAVADRGNSEFTTTVLPLPRRTTSPVMICLSSSRVYVAHTYTTSIYIVSVLYTATIIGAVNDGRFPGGGASILPKWVRKLS